MLRVLRLFVPPQIGICELTPLITPKAGEGTPMAGEPVVQAHLATNGTAEFSGPNEASQFALVVVGAMPLAMGKLGATAGVAKPVA